MGKEMSHSIKTDGKGNALSSPVLGYTLFPLAKTFFLLAMEYVESPEELDTGASKQIQFALTPEQALELAGALKIQATQMLEPLPPGTPRQ